MSNDEKKFQPIFQILHIKSAWFLLELAMALVTTIGMRFLQVCAYCLDIFILWNQAGKSENGGRSCITYMMLPILFLNRN